jgi:DNA-binding transcriptional regulator YiaG
MYQYLGSGLHNVWLENGYHVLETEHGEAVSVEDIDGLHLAIGKLLAQGASPLSGAEFRFLRKELGFSQETLARILGKSSQAVALWEKSGRMPLVADRFLRGLYLEATTGSAGIMRQVEKINTLARAEHEMSLRFDEVWRGAAKDAA